MKRRYFKLVVFVIILAGCGPSLFMHINKANKAYRNRHYTNAVQYYSEALKASPKNVQLYVCRGMSYYSLARYDLAIRDFNSALEILPNYLIAFYYRALSYYANKDYNSAIKDFNRVIEKMLTPYSILYSHRGDCYYNLDEYLSAINDYSKAIEISPDEGNHYYFRGLAYKKMGKFSHAINDFAEAIAIYEKKDEKIELAKTYYQKGKLHYENNELEQAREDLGKSYRLAPESEFAEDAKKLLERMKDRTPPEIIITSPEVSPRGIAVVYLKYEKKIEHVTGKALDESGIAYVTINREPTELKIIDGGAKFHADIPLEWGDNTIIVEAKDEAGNSGTYEFVVQRSKVYKPAERYERIQKWAVVVGISKYKYAEKGIPKLRYADVDAKAFYDFLRSPQGGGFIASHIRLLLDEDATTQNIREAVYDFLKQPIEEDLVIIYFACHGAPEPGNPENMYLITYDTNPEKTASTAFPMWEISTALKRHIKSGKVVILADACHSAAVYDVLAMRDISSNLINKYMAALGEARKGIAVFTASGVGEQSQESHKWGGGHGAFTYFLLEGLRGKADYDENGMVTFGEITSYVSERVRRETNSNQCPITAGRFDVNLPMGVVR